MQDTTITPEYFETIANDNRWAWTIDEQTFLTQLRESLQVNKEQELTKVS